MLDFKASATLTAPSSPIVLILKLIGVKTNTIQINTYSRIVKVLLHFNASAILTAPSSPILLILKLIGVKTNSNTIQIKSEHNTNQIRTLT